jgi:hypothetical protein
MASEGYARVSETSREGVRSLAARLLVKLSESFLNDKLYLLAGQRLLHLGPTLAQIFLVSLTAAAADRFYLSACLVQEAKVSVHVEEQESGIEYKDEAKHQRLHDQRKRKNIQVR